MGEKTEQTNTKLESLQRVVISANWLIILFLGMESGLILYGKTSFVELNSGLLNSKSFTITIVILMFALFLLIVGFCIPIYSKKRTYDDSVLVEIPEKKLTILRIFSEVVLFFVIASTIFYQSKVFLVTESFTVLFLFSLQILMFSKRFKYALLLFVAITFSVQALIFWKALLNPNMLFFTFWIASIILIEFADAVSCIVMKKNI